MNNAPVTQKILHRYMVTMPSAQKCKELAKALREKIPPAVHALYQLSQHRKDPVAVLEKQAKNKLIE